MTVSILILALGMLALIYAADLLVDGASALAKNFGVPTLVIGMTIIALGSSAPEVVVSGMAALNGMGNTAIGNALGSNIANIGLILGITALVSPIIVSKETVRELPFFLLATAVGTLVIAITPTLNVVEGLILLSLLVVFLFVQCKKGAKGGGHDSADDDITLMNNGKAVLYICIGLIGLPIASNFIVDSSIVIAKHFGMSDLAIGLTIIAVGTSLPELAASVASIRKGKHDMALGNVIGSNIFNILAVLSVPAFFPTEAVDPLASTRDSSVMCAFSLALFMMCIYPKKQISRIMGGALLVGYIAYQILVLKTSGL